MRTIDTSLQAESTVKTRVDFRIPHGACDCHVHVFDPIRFPYAAGRLYTPPAASLEDLRALQSGCNSTGS